MVGVFIAINNYDWLNMPHNWLLMFGVFIAINNHAFDLLMEQFIQEDILFLF
jgi:hypothetical protein